ncbi:hypothetical protein BV20DRAFT_825470 [Pilatotrama ljubarskyi]|nr:hypothetical protein BV20DRAFT_825470 [Pilatotrama ljubarskyi]
MPPQRSGAAAARSHPIRLRVCTARRTKLSTAAERDRRRRSPIRRKKSSSTSTHRHTSSRPCSALSMPALAAPQIPIDGLSREPRPPADVLPGPRIEDRIAHGTCVILIGRGARHGTRAHTRTPGVARGGRGRVSGRLMVHADPLANRIPCTQLCFLTLAGGCLAACVSCIRSPGAVVDHLVRGGTSLLPEHAPSARLSSVPGLDVVRAYRALP